MLTRLSSIASVVFAAITLALFSQVAAFADDLSGNIDNILKLFPPPILHYHDYKPELVPPSLTFTSTLPSWKDDNSIVAVVRCFTHTVDDFHKEQVTLCGEDCIPITEPPVYPPDGHHQPSPPDYFIIRSNGAGLTVQWFEASINAIKHTWVVPPSRTCEISGELVNVSPSLYGISSSVYTCYSYPYRPRNSSCYFYATSEKLHHSTGNFIRQAIPRNPTLPNIYAYYINDFVHQPLYPRGVLIVSASDGINTNYQTQSFTP